MCGDINAIEHAHLCGKLLGKVDVLLLLLAEVVHLDSVESLVQVFEELPILFSGEEGSDE